jgi:hypothetical protein
MKEAGIQLRPISALLSDADGKPARYWIPAYQRGYRWTQLQVTQLLDDIRDFTRRPNPQPEEFYCLQPLVIKVGSDGLFEVVDGQQRLTTLLLILRHFNERLAEKYRQKLYSLAYETRQNFDSFLENPDEEASAENVDFFHLYHAIQTIEQWFADHESEVEDIKSALLNKTKVIWFELEDKDDPVAAFTRLNVGKIPLTNDELIRALFLRRAAAGDEGLALRIAHEWDQLEKALQHDAFWYFLSNDKAPGHNRIGLIFELVASDGLTDLLKQDEYGTFHVFNERLEARSAEQEWLGVKQTFMTLEEWYEDRELFHVVGFLIHQGVAINDLLKSAQAVRKGEFAHELRRRAFARAIGGNLDELDGPALAETIRERCENISYGSESGTIRTILLLFNLATLLEDPRSNLRFQFDSFKREEWDIEHVRSVEVLRPVRHNERKDWLEHCRGYIALRKDDKSLVKAIDDFLALAQGEYADAVFDPLYDRVLGYFHEDDEGGEDGLSNLTLLDQSTNRSYKNAVFAVKRLRLLKLDKSGIFVPLCTRNVFLKCYSAQVDNVMFWSRQDAESYGKEIIEILTNFFLQEREAGV